MSGHAWIIENIGTYLAGGLDAAERERFELHTGDCEECARLLDDARDLENHLTGLFQHARPAPGLEDRMIRALRTAPSQVPFRIPVLLRVVAGIAALFVIGCFGAVLYAFGPGGFSPGTASSRNLASVLEPGAVRSGQPGGGELATTDDAMRTKEESGKDEEGEKLGDRGPSTARPMGLLDAPSANLPATKTETPKSGTGVITHLPNNGAANNYFTDPQKPGFAAGKIDKKEFNDWAWDNAAAPGPRPTTLPPAPPPPPTVFFRMTDQRTQPADKPPTTTTTTNQFAQAQPPKPEPEPKPAPKQEDGKKAPPDAEPQRKIIRSGSVDFEVESFDRSLERIQKIAIEEKGFVGTVNSNKMTNGKVKGTIVVRVPPERLDTLMLKLRALGELKGQRLDSQDVTKQYVDLQSRLRNEQNLEERLLQIIKTGKGEIKDLVAANEKLGEVRGRIEQITGEIRYYNSRIALSTLTINLQEKEIRSPAVIEVTERATVDLQVDDVDKARKDAQTIVEEVKGRITKSEFKGGGNQGTGQKSAILHFEVAPEAAASVRDKLKELGRVTRIEFDQLQQAEGGVGRPVDAKIKKKDARFEVLFYNLANVAPRETIYLRIAVADADALARDLRGRVATMHGRVVSMDIKEQRGSQTDSSTIQFEVPASDGATLVAALKGMGDVLSQQTIRNPDTQNSTEVKLGFRVELLPLARIRPRQTVQLSLATRDVPNAFHALQTAVAKAKGRMLDAQLNEKDKENITGVLVFEVRRDDEGSLTTVMSASGDMFGRNVSRVADSGDVSDSKVLMNVKLFNAAWLPPREKYTFTVEVADVDQVTAMLSGLVAESKGKTVESNVSRDKSGRDTAKLVYNVPLKDAQALVEKIKGAGTVRMQQSSRDPRVPASDMAVGQIEVNLGNRDPLMAPDKGFGEQIRSGLSYSLKILSFSLLFLVIGICAILPWVLLIWGIYRLATRRNRMLATPPAANG